MRRVFTGRPSWETWWRVQRSAYFVPPPMLSPVTAGPVAGARTEEDTARERVARERVVPFLLAVVHPSSGREDSVRASAATSIGRAAREPAVVPVLLALLADPSESAEVRAGAALGLGALARSEPGRAFPGALLDRVRERLLATFDHEATPKAPRIAAAVALGLLGDQPFGEVFLARDGKITIQGIRSRLWRGIADDEVSCALIAALGLQPRAGLPEGVWEDLKRLSLGGTAAGFSPSPGESEAAILACGRLGGPRVARLLERVLSARRSTIGARRAAIFALAARHGTSDDEELADVASILGEHMPDARDPVARGMAQITLARVLSEQRRRGSPEGLHSSDVPAFLLEEAASGAPSTRPFSAVALALLCRDLTGDADADDGELRRRARETLLAGASRDGGRSDLRGAYLTALGLWPRARAQASLESVVADRTDRADLRGYGAVALAISAWKAPSAQRAVGIALAEDVSPDLHAEAALALAVLSTSGSTTHLLRELATATTDRTRISLVIALAWRRDPAAAEALRALAEDPARAVDVRSVALLALGRLADPEPRSLLARIGSDSLLPPWLAQRVHDALAGI